LNKDCRQHQAFGFQAEIVSQFQFYQRPPCTSGFQFQAEIVSEFEFEQRLPSKSGFRFQAEIVTEFEFDTKTAVNIRLSVSG
jgi:hypothetical protein